MIKPFMMAGIIITLIFSLVLVAPEVSEAQFCRDEIACSTVTSLGPVSEMILCQYFRSSPEMGRGQTEYVYCSSDNDSQTRTCKRKVAQDLPPVTFTESDWSNETARCAKLCGECLTGWKTTGQP